MIAIILGGGGAKGDFEVGAVRYLYDHGVKPRIICGSSVGAINGIKLAEGAAWFDEGVSCYVKVSAEAGVIPLHRLWNKSSGDHFYTTDIAERDASVRYSGYESEGVACYVYDAPADDLTPLYRLWNPGNGDHFYTTSEGERDLAVGSFGYVNEGVACHVRSVLAPGTSPMYRLLNPANGDHFYTTSTEEKDLLLDIRAPLKELESIWQNLQHNEDMYVPEPWLAGIGDLRILEFFRRSAAQHAAAFAGLNIGWALFPPFAVFNALEAAVDLSKVAEAVSQLKNFRSLFNLDPITEKLKRQDLLNLSRVAASGIRLRMAAVALESGQLHYITGQGQVLYAGGSDHFYTTSADERDWASGDVGYKTEGVACYVHVEAGAERVPLYRLWHPGTGDHFYTASTDERDWAARVESGYRSEGEACYVYPSPASQTTPFYRLLCIAARQIVDPLVGVLASAAIPAVFPAVSLLGENYVDGGVREILPIKAAVEAGATSVYAVAAGAEIAPSEGSFAGANLVDVGRRAVEDIMTDETIENEISPLGGWGVPVTLIRPTFTVHDILTIEPGRISISMAYGYMRAFDSVEFPEDKQIAHSSDRITRLRVEIWQLEFFANGERETPLKPPLRPVPDPDALIGVRQKKRALKELVEERQEMVRKASGGRERDCVPSDVVNWWRGWERHTWNPFILTPWGEFVSSAGHVPAEQAP